MTSDEIARPLAEPCAIPELGVGPLRYLLASVGQPEADPHMHALRAPSPKERWAMTARPYLAAYASDLGIPRAQLEIASSAVKARGRERRIEAAETDRSKRHPKWRGSRHEG